jgi:hypothetical protein
MLNPCAEGDAAAEMLERRWFAAHNAVTAMHADCESLREVLEQAESAWREARLRLAQLEVLRNVLDEELAALDSRILPPAHDEPLALACEI